MFTFVLLILASIVVVGLFVPDKYLPKRKPRRRKRKPLFSNDEGYKILMRRIKGKK